MNFNMHTYIITLYNIISLPLKLNTLYSIKFIYSIEILCNVYVFVVSFIRRACKVQFMHHSNILVQEQL